MPWTPIVVRAWRTSSSLNGLMMATTSFMAGLSPREFLTTVSPNLPFCRANGTKKLQRQKKHSALVASGPVRPLHRPPQCALLGRGFWGDGMADRAWYFAANGQQQGPYGEAQFRDFVA